MSYETQEIAARLKRAREARGLSQRQLAALSGVPQSHISKIEASAVDLRLSSLAALAHAPQPVIPGRAPLALFSRLTPGTHIQPHHGLLNTRLICHLPLIVPDGCGLRVGAETRSWREGEMLIFDDSFEHEAWNRGASDRTILLFEIWRPDIDVDERAQLTRIFAAIDTYAGQ